MSNQQSSKGPTLIGQTTPPQAKLAGAEDNVGLVQPLKVNASGQLLVAVSGAGSGGTSSTDEDAFTAGASAGTPAMGAYQATPSVLGDGELGIVALDENRNLKVNIAAGGGSGGTSSAFGAAFPADGTAVGIADPDGTMAPLSAETFDYDSGAGTVDVTAVGLAIPASGGPLPVLGGHGTAAQALRVELPTDGTGVIATVGAVTAITDPLPAGTNVIGHVITDSGSTTAVTGNVTVVQGTATNLKAQAEAYQGGSAVGAANPLQVSLANTGANATAVKVDGSASIQPVSGTVTANQGTSPWVVAGGGTAGSAATGVVSVQGIASMTPVQVSQATASNLNAAVVGNVADGTAASGNPVMAAAIAKSPDGTSPGFVAEDAVARHASDLNRRLYINPNHPSSTKAHFDGSSAYTDQEIAAAPGSGKQVVITFISFSTGAATACNLFLEEGSTKIFGPVYLEAVAGRGYVSGPICLKVTANTAVTFTTSAAIAQSVDFQYFIQDV